MQIIAMNDLLLLYYLINIFLFLRFIRERAQLQAIRIQVPRANLEVYLQHPPRKWMLKERRIQKVDQTL